LEINSLYTLFKQSSGICTDTRKIKKNCLFIALKGGNFNGNTFAKKALELGAIAAVIDEKEFLINEKETPLVDNTLETLQQLATHHRTKLKTPIVALTGSNGKTTTKELIASVLDTKYNVYATKGNLNNHIGVPLTLLEMTNETEIGIVEMGANHLHEIELLCTIARPNYGYITNFGKAHLEGFGGIEGVIKGKTELYRFLEETNGTVFINTDDPIQIEKSKGINTIPFTTQSIEINKTTSLSEQLVLSIENNTITTQLIGTYNIPNIAAAIAIGNYFNVPMANSIRALENYTPTNNRSQKLKKGSNTVYLDAYNANPTSMKAALDHFFLINGANKWLILGDMFELGPDAQKEHLQLIKYIQNNFKGTALFVGSLFNELKTEASASELFFETFEHLKTYIASQDLKNKHILIKGSRGMALERILEFL